MRSTAYRPGIPAVLSSLVLTECGDRLNAVFKSSYAAGWTLQELADVRGVSREAVRLRTNQAVPVSLLAEMEELIPPKPAKPPLAPKPPKPIESVPAAVLDKINELQAKSARTNGNTPVGDPKRLAGDALCDLVMEVMETYGVSVMTLSRAVGLNYRTLKARLAGRGHIQGSPSQAIYRNKPRVNGRKTHCSRGHERTPENLSTSGSCRTCVNSRAKAYYRNAKAAS